MMIIKMTVVRLIFTSDKQRALGQNQVESI